jgi:hypothetical protein
MPAEPHGTAVRLAGEQEGCCVQPARSRRAGLFGLKQIGAAFGIFCITMSKPWRLSARGKHDYSSTWLREVRLEIALKSF